MRIAPYERNIGAGVAQDFRRHHTQQIRRGGGAESRRFFERIFGARGPAYDALPFDHLHPQAGLAQHGGGDQSVVAGTDDDDVAWLHGEQYMPAMYDVVAADQPRQ